MSFLGRLLPGRGGRSRQGSESAAIAASSALQRLRETEEILQKKTDFLEQKIEEETTTAKKHGMKNRRGELEHLVNQKEMFSPLRPIEYNI